MTAKSWDHLDAELTAWTEAGRVVALWWRDDDAVAVTDPLDRLARLSAEHGAPVTLAVIPANAEPALVPWVAARPSLCVAQHGLTHTNHASAGDSGASEFPSSRPLAMRAADLAEGWRRMTGLFGTDAPVPMMVAPYNKVGGDLPGVLPSVGLSALSVHGPRAAWTGAPVAVVNTHVDLLRWKSNAQFIGTDKAIHRLVDAMASRRLGWNAEADTDQDPTEPIGLLTHHLVHEPDIWAFLADLLPRLRHPAVQWCEARTLIAEGMPP